MREIDGLKARIEGGPQCHPEGFWAVMSDGSAGCSVCGARSLMNDATHSHITEYAHTSVTGGTTNYNHTHLMPHEVLEREIEELERQLAYKRMELAQWRSLGDTPERTP